MRWVCELWYLQDELQFDSIRCIVYANHEESSDGLVRLTERRLFRA